jgi:hypothetical protein
LEKIKSYRVGEDIVQKEKISVDYFDTETAEIKKTEMYVEGFKSKLVKDMSYKGLWTVSFSLREL